MSNIYFLKFKANMKSVMCRIGCKENRPLYPELNAIYKETWHRAHSLVQVRGCFKILRNQNINNFIRPYEYVIPCVLTLGSGISREISRLFECNRCMEAIMLDYLVSNVLFNASKQIYGLIVDKANDEDIHIESRIIPGNKGIPLTFHNNILNMLEEEERLGISITQAFMLKPPKSMAYCYGGIKRSKGRLADNG